MSAVAAPPRSAPARPAGAPDELRGELVRLVVLAPLALFGALHWAALLQSPPRGGALLGLIAALAGGALLLRVPPSATSRVRLGWAVGVTAVLLAGALLAAGMPLRFLEPTYWNDLVSALAEGIASTPAIRVPYRGVDEWVRIAIAAGGTTLVMLAALLATWPRAAGGHGRPIAAAVALGVLYAVPVIENGPTHPFLGGTAFSVLLAAYLYAERLRSDQVGLAVVVLAAVAVGGAVVAPKLDARRPWLDYEALVEKLQPTKAEGFSWNHSYGPLNWPRDGREVLRIRSRTPLYWKAVNLEDFDGRGWRSGLWPSEQRAVQHPQQRWVQTVRVVDRGLASHEFVGAGDALRVLPGASKPALWVPDQTYVAAGAPLRPGDSYGLEVYAPRPTDAELRRSTPVGVAPAGTLDLHVPVVGADRATPNPFPPGGSLGTTATLRFPAYSAGSSTPGIAWDGGIKLDTGGDVLRHGPYARLAALTRRLVDESSDPYDATQRILRRVRDGAVYDEAPPVARYPLASLLFEERRGYCQQFSGTMALMLRMAGIPARVASGFSPGVRDAKRGDYVVSDTDAHSWVEAYFAPYGWITLDPTPGASPARSQTDDAAPQGSGGASTPSGGRAGSPQLGQSGDRPFASGEAGTGAAARGAGTDWRLVAGGGVLALLGLATAAGAWRRRARFAPSAPDLAELERALWRSGRAPAPQTTLAGLERLLGGAAGGAYVRALRDRRFAGSGAGPTIAQRRALRRELGDGLGVSGRLRSWLALPPRLPGRHRRAGS